jgi:predicted AlkP superfamily pyrophosphatase or phosphodiesterase
VNATLPHLARLLACLALLSAGCKKDVAPVPSSEVASTSVAPSRAVTASPAPRPSHIILVSFDGARPDIVQQANMPTLLAMAQEGATTWNAQSIVPPLTLPAHTSMLTGLAPEEHRVYWNYWMPAFGTLRAQTIFMLAKSNGLSSAVFSGKDKLAYLFPTGSVDIVSFPNTEPQDFSGTNVFSARSVATQAVNYFEQRKPHLMFVHFPDADMAGHYYGWPSPEQFAALAECDAALALLRSGIEKSGVTNSVFLLTADHGGNGLSHGVDRPADMTIPWIAWGAGVKRGHALTNAITLSDTAATIAWLFSFSLPTNTIGKPVREAFQ